MAVPGRTTRYKAIRNLPVPDDLIMQTCNHCGERWFSPGDAKRIDAAMEIVYRRELVRRVQAVLPAAEDADRIERDLGLSRGYISRLRKGTKVPSEALLAILALIHKQPAMLQQVEAIWKQAG